MSAGVNGDKAPGIRTYIDGICGLSLSNLFTQIWSVGDLVVPFFCLYAEADNLTHVQIEYGTVVIPGPDLVRVITVLIAVSKRI